MRIAILTTSTNNVAPILAPLTALKHRVTTIPYDAALDHSGLPALVAKVRPKIVVYVGAIPGHHPNVPDLDVLSEIGARYPMVHLCFDGAECHWWETLEQYYDAGRFALMVNIDGVRTGPIGDRGFTTLCPVDAASFRDLPWDERPIPCGFSGGLHADRAALLQALVSRWLVTFRPKDCYGTYEPYRTFLEMCRSGINIATTGGIVGGPHVKHRILELSAAGCLVLETAGSPLSQWFVPGEDYFEYEGEAGAADRLSWIERNQEAAHAMASAMRSKVVERHSPAVFWSQVFHRLGFCDELLPAPEIDRRPWSAAVPSVALQSSGDPNSPLLLESHVGVNIVRYNGGVYVVPQTLGSVHLPDVIRNPQIVYHPTLEHARFAIGVGPVPPPTLVPSVVPPSPVYRRVVRPMARPNR